MKKLVLIGTIVTLLTGTAFAVWWVRARAKTEKTEASILKSLTKEDLDLILQSDSGNVAEIAADSEGRTIFLKGLREYLALAAQARREGLAEEALFKINFDYKKDLLLADLYQAKLSKEQGKNYLVPAEELAAVWNDQANEAKFKSVMDSLRLIQAAVAKERGDQSIISPLQGGSLAKARDNWARAQILSAKAKADTEFMQRREVDLRTKILEAGILSADYLRKHWAEKVKATDAETARYLAAHPEYDVKKKFEAAQKTLERVRAGEDFSKLASELSEDRQTKGKGGLYEDIEKDYIWTEVENAALALEEGQIAPQVIESQTGYHIVKLEKRASSKTADGKESLKFSLRHILFQKAFEDPSHVNPDIPAPFISAMEIARQQVEKEKRDNFVSKIVDAAGINLPEDFSKGSQ